MTSEEGLMVELTGLDLQVNTSSTQDASRVYLKEDFKKKGGF